MKLKRIITFTKGLRKKIWNQSNEDQIEKHNTIILNSNMKLKPLKLLQKDQGKKIEIQRIRTTLENIIFSKLGLNDEIENK